MTGLGWMFRLFRGERIAWMVVPSVDGRDVCLGGKTVGSDVG